MPEISFPEEIKIITDSKKTEKIPLEDIIDETTNKENLKNEKNLMLPLNIRVTRPLMFKEKVFKSRNSLLT